MSENVNLEENLEDSEQKNIVDEVYREPTDQYMIEKWLEENEPKELKPYNPGETQAIGGGKSGKKPKNKHFVSDNHYKDVKH